MTASFSASGLAPMSAAIAGSEVAITVEVHVLHEQGAGHDQRHEARVVLHGCVRQGLGCEAVCLTFHLAARNPRSCAGG